MTETKHISGSARLEAGRYEAIEISGKCIIAGDSTAAAVETSGSLIVEGSLTAQSIHSSGKTEVKGALICEELHASGKTFVSSDTKVNELHNSGKLTIEGNHSGDELSISGMLSIAGNCEVDEFSCSGQVHIDGLLNADDISIAIGKHSFIKEIGGNDISIGKGKVLIDFMRKQPGMLVCELIEGDDIQLDHVKAAVVRGSDVSIGADCQIDVVEYRDSLDIHPDAVVQEYHQMS